MKMPNKILEPGARTPYFREDLEEMLYTAATLLSDEDLHQNVDIAVFLKLFEESLSRDELTKVLRKK